MYLGRKLAINHYHATELSNRIASGWAAFFKFKAALCDRQLPSKDRVKLFEATVTPCVLYGCATWTMTRSMETRLRSTKRRMLRRMVRTTRRQDETWPEFVRRATHVSEDAAHQHGATDWVVLQRHRKWKLAGKIASREDGRWSKKLLSWKPWFRCEPKRSVGHPTLRWEDDLVRVAGGDWQNAACSLELWGDLSYGYAHGTCSSRCQMW